LQFDQDWIFGIVARRRKTGVYADAGYQGIEKRKRARPVRGNVAMRLGKRRKLNLKNPVDAIFDQIERLKGGIRAKVEHPLRVLKRHSAT